MKNNHTNFRVQAHALTDKGRRPNNEDFVTSFEPPDLLERQKSGCIYIVADGVGGASVGERASQYAAEKVLYEYIQYPETEPGRRLKQVITRVNREIFQYAKDKGIRMATTMTVAVVLDNSLIAANVGDSRVYLIHGKEVQQITRDHNIVGELVRDGVMTEAEALKSKAKNRLTRSIGGDEEVHVDIFGPIPLQAGDKIVMCSDGLTRYALKEDIANLATTGSPEQITENLIAFAKERGHGGADNISVITVAYEPQAELAATIQHPRPVAPIQPWEIMETDYAAKQAPMRRTRNWLVWAVTGLLGISILAVTGVLIGFWSGVISFNGIITSTPILTVTLAPSITPVITPSIHSTAPESPPTQAGEQASPMSTPGEQALPTSQTGLTGKIITCPSIETYSNPALDENISKNMGKINCQMTVTLIGRYINPTKREWFKIEFSNENGEKVIAWILAEHVDIGKELLDNLQGLDFYGSTVTPTPVTESAPVPSSVQPTNLVNCIYTVQHNDYLSTIAQKFGGVDQSKITCKLDSAGCTLSDPNTIQEGWQLIVPDVTTELCSSNGGKVFTE
jgi:serine/threonine protein phosphatase PrpC